MRIQLTKISEAPNPDFGAANWGEHIPGLPSIPDRSLPVDYEVRGYLNAAMAVGERIDVTRTHRNGLEVLGRFISSPVVSISGDVVTTRNSRYRILLFP
jgi:hypothetical protein